MQLHIAKGKHYSNVSILNRFPSIIFHPVNVSKNIIIEGAYDTDCRQQINKLFGFSFGFNHHNNSFRFGWRCDKEYFYIYHYYYINRERYTKLVMKTETNNFYNNQFKFKFDLSFQSTNKEILVGTSIKSHGKNKEGYTMFEPIAFPYSYIWFPLYPYFGGTYPAPKDINISII